MPCVWCMVYVWSIHGWILTRTHRVPHRCVFMMLLHLVTVRNEILGHFWSPYTFYRVTMLLYIKLRTKTKGKTTNQTEFLFDRRLKGTCDWPSPLSLHPAWKGASFDILVFLSVTVCCSHVGCLLVLFTWHLSLCVAEGVHNSLKQTRPSCVAVTYTQRRLMT